MSQTAKVRRMTFEEFEVWEQTQIERHELVDGVPQPKFAYWDGAKMMVGASNRHCRISGNVYAELRTRLRGKACQPYASDGKVMIPGASFRYPDVAIDCGPYDPEASHLANPVAVIEVLSKSTFWFDQTRKLRDYQSVPSICGILLLAQDEMRGQLWRREAAGWGMEELDGPDAVAAFPEAGASLTLAEAYDGAL